MLFLDELPEFPPNVIESLRQPIETGEILIARANSHIKYPANFQLIAVMNHCKCRYLSDPHKACSKKKPQNVGAIIRCEFLAPSWIDFDLHIEVGSIDSYNYDLIEDDTEKESGQIVYRVEIARNIQKTRYEGYNIKTNNRLDGQLLIEHALPVDDGKDLLNEAATKFRISMRAYNRILRVARTIADLDASSNFYRIHIAEALNYRRIGCSF